MPFPTLLLSLCVAAGGPLFESRGAEPVGEAAWTLREGAALLTVEPVAGDLVIELEASGDEEAAFALGVEREFSVSFATDGAGGWTVLASADGGDPGEGRAAGGRLGVWVRGPAVEARADGRPVAASLGARPLGGGRLAIRATAGLVRLQRISLRRLPFRDAVVLEGADRAALSQWRSLDRSRFSLLEPLPGIVDPVYRVSVSGGEQTPSARFRLRVCGLRPDPKEIPLLDQALAFARIRPYVSCHLRVGEEGRERVVLGEGPLGPFHVPEGERVVFVCRALYGILDEEWPTAYLRDPRADRFLDRVVPAGPATREMWAVLPEELEEVEVVVAAPGEEPWRRTVRIERIARPAEGENGTRGAGG